jgi:hypothetical protein
MPEADDQIRPAQPTNMKPLRSAEQSEVVGLDHGILSRTVKARHLSWEMLFGGFSGLVMGAVAGEACYWLSGQDDRLVCGALIGAGLGSMLGVSVGIAQRMIRGPFVRPDIGTIIGIITGVSPGLITALLMDNGHGLLSGGALLETLVGGPIVGLFIGAVFDRAFDACRRQAWCRGLVIATICLAVCGSLGWFMVCKPFGPDPNDLAKTAKSMILSEWQQNPRMRKSTIETVALARRTGIHYVGFFDATIDGRPQRFSLGVTVSGQTIGVTWEPVDE